MCDTVCSRHPDRTLFAKNSDRPVREAQLIESFGRRRPGAVLNTQYLQLVDQGADAVLGSRPTWLWGFEHGVNEHRVAIGNERVFTIDDAAACAPALIGMDLVRLGLERGHTAGHALEIMTALLEAHGQGGIADAADDEAYFSSFLIADPRTAWILETSGTTWAAEEVTDGAAISNRLSIRTGWTRAASTVASGTDFETHRDPKSWAALADVRLACTRPLVTGAGRVRDPADLAALLRHHGMQPWGRPGDEASDVSPLPPDHIGPNAEGFSVCMHLRNYQATAAAMICDLPVDADEPLRAWVAPGSPCVSVFVPVFPPDIAPAALAEPSTWTRLLALRERVERDEDELGAVRAVLAPLEADLWAEADTVGADPDARRAFVERAWARVDDGLHSLAV